VALLNEDGDLDRSLCSMLMALTLSANVEFLEVKSVFIPTCDLVEYGQKTALLN
jgi:hypothetical protein